MNSCSAPSHHLKPLFCLKPVANYGHWQEAVGPTTHPIFYDLNSDCYTISVVDIDILYLHIVLEIPGVPLEIPRVLPELPEIPVVPEIRKYL